MVGRIGFGAFGAIILAYAAPSVAIALFVLTVMAVAVMVSNRLSEQAKNV